MYIGLETQSGQELNAKGYRRICIDHVRWGMLPGSRDNAAAHLSFVNLDSITFPEALEDWGRVHIRLFVEPMGETPVPTTDDNWYDVYCGDVLLVERGMYRFSSNIKP